MVPMHLLGCVGIALLAVGSHAEPTYKENAVLKYLADGSSYVHMELEFSHLNETVAWSDGHMQYTIPRTSPTQLVQLAHENNATEFHATFSSGRWRDEWGYPQGISDKASGTEIWAWLLGTDDALLQDHWIGLTSGLSGFFCSGVGLITPDRTWHPRYTHFSHRGGSLFQTVQGQIVSTCTESLTPLSRMLPCETYGGLGMLLKPHQLFDSSFIGFGIHYIEEKIVFELDYVRDVVKENRLAGGLGRRDSSFQSLFGTAVTRVCPISSASVVNLILPGDSVHPFDVSDVHKAQIHGDMAVFNVTPENVPLNPGIAWEDSISHFRPNKQPEPRRDFLVKRVLKGNGQERGRLGVILANLVHSETCIVWSESWPWHVRPFMRSLEKDGSPFDPLWVHYVPSVPHERPTHFEMMLCLAPETSSELTIEYENAYLWFTDYSSDPNRGFSIPGAHIVVLKNGAREALAAGLRSLESFINYHLYSTTAFVICPLPDFSMPYNVIIFTSTILALFFGMLTNLMLRRFAYVEKK